MICISLPSTDTSFNLAADEFLLKNTRDEFLLLSINDPSVIIGKHQSAHIESDTQYVSSRKIQVFRRISGGGAVFHDHGNLNFSFISNSTAGRQVDFRKYTSPVIEFLRQIGVNASFEGKNDLKVNGLKISGNAEHVYRERVLHHGTLLFESDMEALHGSLRKDNSSYSSKSVFSNPSKVINLRDCGTRLGSAAELKEMMLRFFLGLPDNSLAALSDDQAASITSLASTKYRTWEWNYGYGPAYTFEKTSVFRGREISVKLSVKDGLITGSEITGPGGFEAGSILAGCRHMPVDIPARLENAGFSFNIDETFIFF